METESENTENRLFYGISLIKLKLFSKQAREI